MSHCVQYWPRFAETTHYIITRHTLASTVRFIVTNFTSSKNHRAWSVTSYTNTYTHTQKHTNNNLFLSRTVLWSLILLTNTECFLLLEKSSAKVPLLLKNVKSERHLKPWYRTWFLASVSQVYALTPSSCFLCIYSHQNVYTPLLPLVKFFYLPLSDYFRASPLKGMLTELQNLRVKNQ